MLNSVVSYLWGSSSETDQNTATTTPAPSDGEQARRLNDPAAVGDGSQLAETKNQDEVAMTTHPCDEDDWVLVGFGRKGKENKSLSSKSSHHRRHHRLHHINSPHHISSPNTAEVDVLDDAASLMMAPPAEEAADGLEHEMGMPFHADLDSNYSSDTESSPESVFSACSGRSHATYRPHGAGSEPWLVAPAPCFTGSQTSGLSPVAASPLENLLIEHPSMSVYLSYPSFVPPSSHTPHSAGGDAPDSTAVDNSEGGQQESRVTSLAPRPRSTRSLVHPVETSTPQQLARIEHAAQKLKRCTDQKAISAQRCDRQNKARDFASHPRVKTNNKRNKHTHASGAKSSRFSQRM